MTPEPTTPRSKLIRIARPVPLLVGAAALVLVASLALGQGTNPFGYSPGPPGTPGRTAPPPPKTPLPAPASPVIARVAGRPITQADFDRMAGPYMERLRAELRDGFTEQVRQTANRNVIDELIRREVLIVEAKRRNLIVTEEDTDRLLKQDPFFSVNGRFDPARFLQFKMGAGSSYTEVLPRIRELAAATKLDSTTRARLKPSRAELRTEWARRSEQVSFQYLSLPLQDVSLEAESDAADQAAYYAAHPDQFMRRPRAHLRYLSLGLPATADSTRAAAEAVALMRGRRIADTLRAGASLDSIAPILGGVLDTGPIDLPALMFPRLGRSAALTAEFARADSDTTLRVVGPVVVRDQVVVGEIAGREPRRLPALREVLGDVKRRADLEKRRSVYEAERRAYLAAHPDSFRTARCLIQRVVAKEPDSSRMDRKLRALAAVTAPWRSGRDFRRILETESARLETLSLVRGMADSVFSPALLDSLVSGSFPVGTVTSPRRFGQRAALWRVGSLDSAWVPPFETVRARADMFVQQEKRARDEKEAEGWFETHRDQYRTRPRFEIDWVAVKIPAPDSVRVPEARMRRWYDAHLAEYRREEEVRARHILISSRPGRPDPRVLADSLLEALRGGADFADLARRFSGDPGSAAAGGDLGFFPRGRMVPEFNDTAFALQVGRVSGLVKTQYGYHILKVEERHPAGIRPFTEARTEIRARLAQTIGDSLAQKSAGDLRRRLAAGGDAAALAGPSGGLHTSAPFAEGEAVPDVGPVDELSQALASLPLARWAPKPYRAPNAWVLARPKRRIAPGPAEFVEVKRQAVEDMKRAKQREIMGQRVASIRAALAAGATLDSVAAPYGGLKDSGPVTRTSALPGLGEAPRLIELAFASDSGRTSDTLETAVGVAWIRSRGASRIAGASFDRDAPTLEQELLVRRYTSWIEGRRAALGVQILRADLRPLAPQALMAPDRRSTSTTRGGTR